jgi:hypothetical protein
MLRILAGLNAHSKFETAELREFWTVTGECRGKDSNNAEDKRHLKAVFISAVRGRFRLARFARSSANAAQPFSPAPSVDDAKHARLGGAGRGRR